MPFDPDYKQLDIRAACHPRKTKPAGEIEVIVRDGRYKSGGI